MKISTEKITNLFNPSNRKWTIPIVAVVAVALIGAAIYYGDYIRYIFTGVKASDIKTWTWNLDNESEYTATPGVTFGPDSASVDLEFSFINSIPPDFENITDLWYNDTNILGAAVDYDNVVGYSVNNGDDWGVLPIKFANQTATDRGIRIKRIADGGNFNQIFGLGTTAQSGTAKDNAAAVYGNMTTEDLDALNYVMVPTAKSFTAGTVFSDRLYGALEPKTIGVDPLLISILPDLTDPEPQYPAIGTPGQTTSINNFIVVGNRLYATVTDTDIPSDWGKTRIWVTEDGTNWTQAAVNDPSDHSINHNSANSIVYDTEGYIYATISEPDVKLSYILKSTQPYGVVFKKVNLPEVPGLINKIYTDNSNNIWLPLTSGTVLRSTDYQSGVGATSFYPMNSEISFPGSGNRVLITDIQKLSNRRIIWAGGIWQNNTFIRGAGWSSRTADPQTVYNKTGIEYFNLLHFSVDSPPVASNEEFRYQIRNTDPASGKPWYYYDSTPGVAKWVPAPDLSLSNTADEVDAHINEFKDDVGYSAGHNIFHFRAVHDQADTDQSSYDIVLRSIDLEYLSPAPHFQIDVEPFVQVGNVFDITITALNPDETVITSFKPNGVDNDPSWALRSNLMSVPPSGLAFDDGLLVCPSAPFGSGWNNGVLTYTGCQIAVANNDEDRWIGVSYLNVDVGKLIFNYAPMRVIDVTTLPVGRFEVELLVDPVPPVDDQVFVDQQFALTAEARVGAEYGDFVKTNFVPDPLEGPVKVNLAANGNGAIITPATIGDADSGTGDWANGLASYTGYSVNIAGVYLINVDYLSANGRHPIAVVKTPPHIESIDPTEGPVGQLVKIYGSDFGDTVGIVRFDADEAHIVDNSWTDTSVEVFAPFKPGSAGSDLISFVTLSTADGLDSDNNAQFIYKFATNPAPTVTDIDPNMGSVDTNVTITGSNFMSGANVRFGADFATGVNFVNSTTLVAIAPDHEPGSVNVVVINPDTQFAISPEQFTYLPIGNLLPVINNIDPNHGQAIGGNPVTIYGSNFGGSITAQSSVKFGDATATITSWSDSVIAVSAPAGEPMTGVLVTVTTNAGTSEQTISYTYDALPDSPVIYSLDPDEGPSAGGTLVTITGNNLGDIANKVYFGTKLAQIVYWSNTTIRVLSPIGISGGAGIIQVHVTRLDGLSSGNLPFKYLDTPSFAKAVRYYSRNYLVTELSSLDSITISAGTNGVNSHVSVALGLFDASGAPVFTGDDGLGTGYFTLDNDNQSANLFKLTHDIMGGANFDQVRMLRFRIDMYTPDITADVLEQPWVESISLGYTLVEGEMGAITFATGEILTKDVPNNTSAFISYNMVATSNLIAGVDPTFNNVIIGINWLDDPTALAGFHAWVVVASPYGTGNNIITSFGPGNVVPFQVRFSSETGVYLGEGSYRFEITGRLLDNPSITLTKSEEGTVITHGIGTITFDSATESEPYEKTVPNSGTPISYNMIATADLSAADAPLTDVVLGIDWLDTPKFPEGTHVWIVVASPYGTGDNIITSLAFGDVVPFKVFFSGEDGVSLGNGKYHFAIKGSVQSNPTWTLVSSPTGAIITTVLSGAEDFSIALEDDDQLSHPGGQVSYQVNITYDAGFPGEVDFENDLVTVGDPYITSADFDPDPTSADQSILTVVVDSTPLTTEQTIEFTITGTSVDDPTKTHQLNATLTLRNLADDDFALMIAEPHDQTTQANGVIIYDINLDYGNAFTDDILLTHDLTDMFIGVTGVFNTDTVENGVTTAFLTVTAGGTPSPVNSPMVFAITGTATNDDALFHDATPAPILTIVSTANTVLFELTIPLIEKMGKTPETNCVTDPYLCDEWNKHFMVNIYVDGATDPRDDLVIAFNDIEGYYDPDQFTDIARTNTTVELAVAVERSLLQEGALYTVYARSPRHVWVKSVANLSYESTMTVIGWFFPEAYVGDVNIYADGVFTEDIDRHDNFIDTGDLWVIAPAWNQVGDLFNALCDFNNDDVVDTGDLFWFAKGWGEGGAEFMNNY